MKGKQRKTLVKDESWPLIEGWYWCPISVVEKRIKEYQEELTIMNVIGRIGVGYEFNKWAILQHRISSRLAHQCRDGSIRAPSWVQTYTRKSGCRSLYGRCKSCREPLSNGVKTIIIMESM